MRIGVMSDLHLGLRQYGLKEREEDFYIQYDYAIDSFITTKVDCVICAGDIFDHPRPSPKALSVFINGMKRLSEHGIEIVNIIGNHSMIQSPDFVTADEVVFNSSGLDNGFLLDKDNFKLYENDDITIFGLPYYFNFEINTMIKTINELNTVIKESGTGKNILVLHQSFKEFCGFSGEELSIDDINYDAFDLVICGHIHSKQLCSLDDSTVFLQPGSLERSSVAEARDEEVQGKGVFIFDTDDLSLENISNGFLRLKCERQFFVSNMYIDSTEEIETIKEEILEKIKDCVKKPVINLTVHDSSMSFQQLIDMTKDLKKDCLICHFTYVDESNQVDENFNGFDAGDLTPQKLIKLALNPLSEEEAQLGLDLFNLLKDDKDVSGLLEEFRQKRYCCEQVKDKNREKEFNKWVYDIECWVNS